MRRPSSRTLELIVLALIALGALYVAYVMVQANRMGEAFGTLLVVVTTVVNRIGNLGQSQAMQSMADHLARSAPARDDAQI